MKSKLVIKFTLFAILILAASFRVYNVNWDQGHHLHPDERAIIMAVEKLKFPNSVSEFLSPTSSWNPQFFAYGSFPMYLLRISGNAIGAINPSFSQYTSINLVGRVISAFADIITIIFLFKITRKLFNPPVGLMSAFFYAISVLPIQLSHFYAVDTILTCFVLATLYQLLRFYEKPSIGKSLLICLFFGLALATKVSALVLLVSIGTALTADFILIFLKKPHKPAHWLPHLPPFLKHLLKYAFIICITTVVTFIFFEPYAVIDFKNFWAQTIQQSALTNNPFNFPYTLQYVGKIPYFYEFKNVFLWGLGPVLGSLVVSGIFYFIYLSFRKERGAHFAKEAIILIFFLSYFFVVGKFAVGFMRYLLPIYPLFALFAAILVYGIVDHIKVKNLRIAISYLLFAICLIWPLSFVRTYSKPNTRVTASNWVYDNIPPGKIIAVEHWDDQLPIGRAISYNILTLNLYDPDTKEKWDTINWQLAQTDYVIIASNRLYAPLQKLTDCQKLPTDKCYPKTAEYYKKLFSEDLDFKKVAEFTNYPTVPILNIPINDQPADENFTVFDHPKILIFKNLRKDATM